MPIVRMISSEMAFVSEEIRDYYRAAKNEGIVLPEAVDTEFFNTERNHSSGGPETTSTESIRIGFLGNVSESKGLEYLLEAIPSVVSQMPQCRFVIGGSWQHTRESYRRRLTRIIGQLSTHEKPEIIGFVPDPRTFYRSLDIFCLPSCSEGTPLVIMEAMACGVPIVATDVGGVRSLVSDGEDGFLVPQKSPEALANMILKLASRRELRQSMSKRARLKAQSHFSIDTILGRYDALYRRLTALR